MDKASWQGSEWVLGSWTDQGPDRDSTGIRDPQAGGASEVRTIGQLQRLGLAATAPLRLGQYLRARLQLRVQGGPLTSAQIVATVLRADGSEVPADLMGKAVLQIGQTGEISATFGPGARNGVDIVCGPDAARVCLALDVKGPLGAIVGIGELCLEDVSAEIMPNHGEVVDVTDFGAVGNGHKDCADAFEAANAAAKGRRLHVPSGCFWLSRSVTLDAAATFVGQLRMPLGGALVMRHALDLPTYIAAFGGEEPGFVKALQALLRDDGHVALDMGGRRVRLSAPVDVSSLVPERSGYGAAKALRNGRIEAGPSAAWSRGAQHGERYLLDFSGFTSLSDFLIADVAFACNRRCGTVRWPAAHPNCRLRDCAVHLPFEALSCLRE